MRQPPGIPAARGPAPYAAGRLALNPLGYYPALARRYGDVFGVSFPGFPPGLVVADLSLARQVLNNHERFLAGSANALVFGDLDGEESLVGKDGPEHRFLRRSLAPLSSWARRHQALLDELFANEVGRWPLERPLAAHPRLEPVVLDLALRYTLALGLDEAPELASAVRRMAHRGRLVIKAPMLRRDLGPGSPWRRFVAARRHFDQLLLPRLEKPRSDDCALGLLIQARDERGHGLSRAQVRDQITSLLMAGTETTAAGAAWAFERLAAHPTVMREAQSRVRMGDTEYLDAVVRETLRLRPPFGQVWRIAAETTELGDYSIRAGTLVMIAINAIHRDPRTYEDPDTYCPRRFLNGAATEGWLALGGGARMCLGATLARQMMRAALAAALTRGSIIALRPRGERPILRGGVMTPLRGGRFRLRGDG